MGLIQERFALEVGMAPTLNSWDNSLGERSNPLPLGEDSQVA